MTDDPHMPTPPVGDEHREPRRENLDGHQDDDIFFDFDSNADSDSDSDVGDYDLDRAAADERLDFETDNDEAVVIAEDDEPGPLVVDVVEPAVDDIAVNDDDEAREVEKDEPAQALAEPEPEPESELEPELEPELESEPYPDADVEPEAGDEAAVAPARVRKRVDVRALAALLGRLSAGVITAWLAIAAIGGATIIEVPTLSVTPPSVVVTPVPASQQLVCPGAFLRLADESGQDASSTSPISRPSTRYLSTGGDATILPLAESESGTGGTADAPLVLSTVIGDSAGRTMLAGAQSQSVDSDEARGFDATECSAAGVVSWLVGGASDLGRTTVISLTNPTEVAATVDLEIYGESGVVQAPGTTGIIVPAGSQRLLPLAAFVPDVKSPAIHVTSTGGQIVATMQQTTVRTLDPGGVDSITGAASPSTTTVISGVRLLGVERVQALLGEVGFTDLTTLLRLLVPGETPTNAQISIIPESSGGTGMSFSLQLAAGRVTDIPLDEIENGTYTVVVNSDAPVTAGLRVSTVGATATDFAWLAADRRLVDQALVTVAPGPSPLLHLYNPTTETATITVSKVNADASDVEVPAGAAVSLPVAAGGSYVLSGFDRVMGSVSYAGDGALGSYPVLPASDAPPPVVVFLR